jgi:hypothetical protein
MAFRFNEASSGSIRAFAEDYLIKPSADGCHLTWVMAMQPNGAAARLGTSLGRPVMSWLFQKFLYNLRDYAKSGTPTRASKDRPRPPVARRRDRRQPCRGPTE